MHWGQPSVSSQFNKTISAGCWSGDSQIMERPAGFAIHSYSTSFVIMMQCVMLFSPFMCVLLHAKSFNRTWELLFLLTSLQVYVAENSNLATKRPLALLQWAITDQSQEDLRADSREVCDLARFLKHTFQVKAPQAHPAGDAACGLTFALKAHSEMKKYS